MTFRKQIRYRFGDIDHAGIAYYPGILHCFHCVFEDWWAEALGRSYAQLMSEDGLGLPSVRLEADFFAPIRYGDEPEVHLGVLRIGQSSAEFGFWMTRPGSDRPLCRARVTTAAVQMGTMQKRDLPEPWRTRFTEYALAEADFPTGR